MAGVLCPLKEARAALPMGQPSDPHLASRVTPFLSRSQAFRSFRVWGTVCLKMFTERKKINVRELKGLQRPWGLGRWCVVSDFLLS